MESQEYIEKGLEGEREMSERTGDVRVHRDMNPKVLSTIIWAAMLSMRVLYIYRFI